MALSTEEQELHINASRNDEFAVSYVTDSTWITKLDKLVNKNPKEFSVISETEWGKTYKFPKNIFLLGLLLEH